MDRNEAKALTKFLLSLHEESRDKLGSYRALYEKCKKFDEKHAKTYESKIFFSEKGKHALSRLFENLMINAPIGQESPYLLLDSDPTKDWIKILRLLVNPHGKLNAEVIYLSAQDDEDRSFGFRYEHPESFSGPGGDKHAFFHIQPIIQTSIGGTDIALPGAVHWFPTSSPAFFMMAHRACEVVIYAVHSVCGWECLRELPRDIDSYALKRLLLIGPHATNSF